MSPSAGESVMLYSPGTGGFYHPEHHGERAHLAVDPAWFPELMGPPVQAPELVKVVTRESVIPADAAEITEARWRELLDGQASGKRIVAGEGGVPTLADPPAPNPEEWWAWVRRERDRRIAKTDWTQLPDVPETLKAKWAPHRQALRDVPQTTADPSRVEWPQEPA